MTNAFRQKSHHQVHLNGAVSHGLDDHQGGSSYRSANVNDIEFCRDQQVAVSALQPYMKSGSLPENVLFLAMKNQLHRGGCWKIAHAMMREIEKNHTNTRPNYLYAIGLCCKDTHDKCAWQAALDMYQEMRSKKFVTDAICTSQLIGACTKAGRPDYVHKLMGQMFKDEVPPDNTVFNTALDACDKAGGQWEQALQYLTWMTDSYLTPDIVSYSAVISSCRLSSNDDVAFQMLDEMSKHDSSPNLVAYTAAIGCCSKAWTRALNIMDMMRSDNIAPNQVTYTAAMTVLGKNAQYEKVLEMLNEMKSASVKPNRFTYNACIDSMAPHAQWERTLSMMAEMRKARLIPDRRPYNTIFSNSDHINMPCSVCLQLWKQMITDGVQPTVRIYHCMLSRLLSAKQNHLVLKFAENMQANGFELSMTTYNLIKAARIGIQNEGGQEHIESSEKISTCMGDNAVLPQELPSDHVDLQTSEALRRPVNRHYEGHQESSAKFSSSRKSQLGYLSNSSNASGDRVLLIEDFGQKDQRILAEVQDKNPPNKHQEEEEWVQRIERMQELDSLRSKAGIAAREARRPAEKMRNDDGTFSPVPVFNPTKAAFANSKRHPSDHLQFHARARSSSRPQLWNMFKNGPKPDWLTKNEVWFWLFLVMVTYVILEAMSASLFS